MLDIKTTPMADAATAPAKNLFEAIPERNTGDNMLRTAQQHHVQLSVMADVKANIIITVSSIVLTMTLGRLNDPGLRVSAVTLLIFTTIALLLAILAVLPKYRPLRLKSQTLPSNFNLLFFGHFAELSRDRFLNELAAAMKPDGTVYETVAKDLYSLGYYLAHFKYRYLRLAYLFFLTGFILAALEQLWAFLASLL
ncbi:MAG TPA: Pycsar system effector family protein [Xanthomonadales bacterium]|nr:Pycsar system effector family protein [Xanthomonadales bacterium]